ncbi:MAG: hypothetical protein OEZ08_14555 [Betaproteobacteria bacterium]|nr:hypothetical protein [Betaproteobacteria bacterium]
MKFSALAARCARAKASKPHIALPLLIIGMLYWFSSLPGTLLLDDLALYAVFYWVPPSVQNALHVPPIEFLVICDSPLRKSKYA